MNDPKILLFELALVQIKKSVLIDFIVALYATKTITPEQIEQAITHMGQEMKKTEDK